MSQTFGRSVQILDTLARNSPSTSAELAKGLNLNRTIVSRLLESLRAAGVVSKVGLGFHLSGDVVSLASNVEQHLRLAASDPIARLAAKLRATTIIHVQDGDHSTILVSMTPPTKDHIAIFPHVGHRTHVSHGAVGLAFLSHSSQSLVRKVAKHHPDVDVHTLVDRAAQLRVIDFSIQPADDEVREFASPIVDVTGNCAAVISVVVPADDVVDVGLIHDSVIETATDIESRLPDALDTRNG